MSVDPPGVRSFPRLCAFQAKWKMNLLLHTQQLRLPGPCDWKAVHLQPSVPSNADQQGVNLTGLMIFPPPALSPWDTFFMPKKLAVRYSVWDGHQFRFPLVRNFPSLQDLGVYNLVRGSQLRSFKEFVKQEWPRLRNNVVVYGATLAALCSVEGFLLNIRSCVHVCVVWCLSRARDCGVCVCG